MEKENDIILHCKNCAKIELNTFSVGKYFENNDINIEFYYDENEGTVWTDFLANDKGWFIVSEKLKSILQSINSEIQFIDIHIFNIDINVTVKKYYIANIVKVVDALCLSKSDYFETYIEGKGIIYTISKYAIYEDKTKGADVFKLDNWQQIPIFVSETFKSAVEANNCTGMSFQEIAVDR